MTSAGLAALLDTAAQPGRAFNALRERGNAVIAVLALLAAVLTGASVQGPVVARANADQLQKSFDAGRGGGYSQAQSQTMVDQALKPPLAVRLVNPAIYFALIAGGVAFEAGIAALLLVFLNGSPNYGRLLVAFLNIAFWTIGVYYLATSAIVRIGFVTEGSDAVFPSLLTLWSGATDLFVRGILASLNVFLVLALWLHAVALRELGAVNVGKAYTAAAILAVAEIGASALLSKVFG